MTQGPDRQDLLWVARLWMARPIGRSICHNVDGIERVAECFNCCNCNRSKLMKLMKSLESSNDAIGSRAGWNGSLRCPS